MVMSVLSAVFDRFHRGWIHGAALAAVVVLFAYANPAQAQVSVDQIGANSQQVVSTLQTSNNQLNPALLSGSSSTSASIQVGSRNFSGSIIDESPGSMTGQVQFGEDNSSVIGIKGGAANFVGVVQVGNNFQSQIFLKDSVGTRVFHVQMPGKVPYGSINVLNAPPGTTISVK
jgi:hypothetical protein